MPSGGRPATVGRSLVGYRLPRIPAMLDGDRADVLFTGGHVWTGIERRGPAEAVAVRGGRIMDVGTAADLAWARGPRTRVVPLAGRLLLPAFQDAHVHPVMGGLGLSRCWLSDVPADPSAYLRVIADYAIANPELPWVVGEGWSLSAFPGGVARATDLDSVVSDRPAFLESRDGHSV